MAANNKPQTANGNKHAMQACCLCVKCLFSFKNEHGIIMNVISVLFFCFIKTVKNHEINLAMLYVNKFPLDLTLKKDRLLGVKRRTFYPQKSVFFSLMCREKLFFIRHSDGEVKLCELCIGFCKQRNGISARHATTKNNGSRNCRFRSQHEK